jgi:hypothetical protein
VLDGPGGAAIGNLVTPGPDDPTPAISAPAVDLFGNVYLVAAWEPLAADRETGLFRAVWTGSAYELDLLLTSGDLLTGANSATPYRVSGLTLADSDSLASGGFHGGQLLWQPAPGATPADGADPAAIGGVAVNAQLRYSNAGVPERYEAVLLIRPTPAETCEADIDGSGATDVLDLNILLGSFNQPVPVGESGDLTGDGFVDVTDLNALLGDFGCGG